MRSDSAMTVGELREQLDRLLRSGEIETSTPVILISLGASRLHVAELSDPPGALWLVSRDCSST